MSSDWIRENQATEGLCHESAQALLTAKLKNQKNRNSLERSILKISGSVKTRESFLKVN